LVQKTPQGNNTATLGSRMSRTGLQLLVGITRSNSLTESHRQAYVHSSFVSKESPPFFIDLQRTNLRETLPTSSTFNTTITQKSMQVFYLKKRPKITCTLRRLNYW